MPYALSLLAQRITNTPLLLHPKKCEVVVAALAERLGITSIAGRDGKRLAFDEDDFGFTSEARDDWGYDIVDGIAMIQVEGMLVQKLGCVRPWSGLTGYDGLRTAFLTALDDVEVRAIVLDINSGGGEVSGCFELADLIYASRGMKPIWAICGDHAYSAAYALASACDRITVPRLGGVGSVGVIVVLMDYSEAIKRSGLAVHFVTYGQEKAQEFRQSQQGIKPELLDRIAADITVMGDVFTETVARNRNMAVSAIRAQQADYFLGARGVEMGLADAVQSPDQAIESLFASLG